MSTVQEIKTRSALFPYFKQETNYTCGPACARIMLARFGHETFEMDLEKLLECVGNKGTAIKAFDKLLEPYNLDKMEGDGSPTRETLDYLDGLCKDGWVVMLAYSLDVPHFSIFIGHNENHVLLCDPFRGPHVGEVLRKFPRIWKVEPHLYDGMGLDIGKENKTSGYWVAFRPKQQK